MTQPGKPSNPAEPDSPVPPGFVSAAPGAQALAIDPEAVERIERIAAEYLDSIASVPAGSPEYTRTIAAIDHLGERDFIATSAMSGRVLDRRFAAMRGLLAARAPLARQLADLRKAAAELDPARIKLGGRSSPRDELEELDRYFERFAHSQPRLEQILGSLTEGRLALEQDNAAILTEQASLSTEMETLRQYAFLAGRLDDQLAARIEQAAGTDAAARAEALRLDVLPVVRRRHQEILTQLAIVMQGYSALRIVEDKDATPEELAIDEINAGIYAFDAAWLRARIGDVKASPISGELYLPELVALARYPDEIAWSTPEAWVYLLFLLRH